MDVLLNEVPLCGWNDFYHTLRTRRTLASEMEALFPNLLNISIFTSEPKDKPSFGRILSNMVFLEDFFVPPYGFFGIFL